MGAKPKTAPSATPVERIAECRQRLGNIDGRLRDIERAAPSSDEIRKRVDALATDIRQRAELKVGVVAIIGGGAESWRDGSAAGRIAEDLGAVTAVEMLALLSPERLRDWLASEAEAGLTDGDMRIDPAAAADEREQLEAEREALEITEEIAIREIEADGGSFGRRGDASPAVVLAPDHELA